MFENRSYLNLLEESWPGMKANIIRCESLGFFFGQSKPFLKKENGETLSHLGFLDYPMIIEGSRYKVAALHAICTKASQRNQGLASQLIQDALKRAKNDYEWVVLFTAIPNFYEKFSFRVVQEYRFRFACQRSKGSQSLRSVTFPDDNALFLRSFQERAPLSNNLWIKESGAIASFNTLFATYPVYWSLYYSPSIGIISYLVKDKTLHLFDVIAKKLPSLDLILDHLPAGIEEIYFYFSPDRFTDEAVPEPYLYDNGYFMVHGNWPNVKPFMIPPISRC